MRDRRMTGRPSGVSRWLAALAAVGLMTLVAPVVRAAVEAEREAPQTKLVGVVNVNTATLDELQLLPGVGPVRAKAIVEHRREHGGFKSAEDLLAVSGIGERALARIRGHVAFSGKTTARLER